MKKLLPLLLFIPLLWGMNSCSSDSGFDCRSLEGEWLATDSIPFLYIHQDGETEAGSMGIYLDTYTLEMGNGLFQLNRQRDEKRTGEETKTVNSGIDGKYHVIDQEIWFQWEDNTQNAVFDNKGNLLFSNRGYLQHDLVFRKR